MFLRRAASPLVITSSASTSSSTVPSHQLVFALQSRDAPQLLSVHDGGRPYVVGFRNVKHARRIASALDPARPLRIRRSGHENVTADLNASLASRASTRHAAYERVTLDVCATLEVPLMRKFQEAKVPLVMRALRVETFLMYPFEHCLGIVIIPLEPYDASYNSNAGTLTFGSAHVIDASDDDGELRRRAIMSTWDRDARS